jgi:hypothetical protein
VDAEADLAGQRAGRRPEGRRLLPLGVHYRRDPLSHNFYPVDVGYRVAAGSSLQANEQGDGSNIRLYFFTRPCLSMESEIIEWVASPHSRVW